MSLTGTVIGFVADRAAKRFEPASQDPAQAQRDKLMSIVQRNAETEYGRKYGFASITNEREYRERVPTISYEDIRTDMMRVTEGAKGVFTAEDVVMFAQTSGTTGEPKFIPVTATCNGRDHQDTFRTWLAHARRGHPNTFDGKVLSLVSPAVEGHTPAGIPFGSTSGQIYRSMPGIIRRGYSIPYPAFEIEDYTAKYYAIMRICVEDDVTFLLTANPSTVLKMCEKANEFSEQIIADIRDGAIAESMSIEPHIRQVLERRLRPNPRRAQQLEQARQRRQGTLKPGDYWPRLALLGCWKGGTVGHYLEKFPQWFDPDGTKPVPVRDLGFLSSECRGSITLNDQGSAGALTVGANYFEFVPREELEAHRDEPSAWPFVSATEVEDGREYYIFVTTTGGLYRYDMNDVVRFEGKYNQTPQMVFVRKGRGMTNITGEKLSVNQVIHAMQHAAEKTGAIPDHYKAEADEENSRYVIRVEFTTWVGPDVQSDFLQAVDTHLKGINIEYEAKRKSMRLANPVLHVMREGWYERDRQARVASGYRAFQAKTQLLSARKQATVEIKPELLNVVELDEES